jgi:trans-aconitate methyltransferase
VRDRRPEEPVDVLVSNAVLHWVPGHDRLLALEVLTGAGLSGEDPVLGWVRSTVLRPVLPRLNAPSAGAFTAEYAARLRTAYPPRPDGSTLLPFRRLFAVGSARS